MIQEPRAFVQPSVATNKRRRSWSDRFSDAFRGIKLGIRGQSSFAVHFFCAVLTLAACVALECRVWEWCVILICIGGVFVAELLNSAIETLFQELGAETKSRWNGSLDIAAGAVLTASLFAAVIGAIVFINRFGESMKWWE